MALRLLFNDELKGFYKSNVMIGLWIGLPIISILFYLLTPEVEEGMSFAMIASTVISSTGGFLASMMLAVNIIHEKSRNIFELFLIRPIKRRELLISKFLSVFFCVAVASLLALLLGIAMDYIFHGGIVGFVFKETLKSFLLAVFIISVECAGGVLIGVFIPFVLAGVILVVVCHNIATMAVIMPSMLKMPHSFLFSLVMGVVITGVFLFLAVYIFAKKQF